MEILCALASRRLLLRTSYLVSTVHEDHDSLAIYEKSASVRLLLVTSLGRELKAIVRRRMPWLVETYHRLR
jgi:hypothetical protein